MGDKRGSIAATLVLAGCGTFLPAEDDPPSTTGSDAAVAEAGVEAGADASDGGDTPDAIGGPDAGCTRVFEERFLGGWAPEWAQDAEGGAVVILPSEGKTAPGALHAEVVAGGSSTKAQIARQITPSFPLPKTATLAFAMRVPAASSNYFELGCTLQLATSDLASFLSLQTELSSGGELAFDSNAQLDGGNIPTGDAIPIGPRDGEKWYAVEIALAAMTTASALVTLRVDGVVIDERVRTFPAPPNRVRVKCGVDFGQTGGAATAYVDDVVLDTCP